ncbi:hypothetical protein [Robiginitomaculum antarcticum]|uniref:hypothetical protein n=1 Tax=Robiginitomaculum antarcticum TaxID=437507 RepID=UPI00037DA7D6|nr:hypothetical protein [Robiginitomaculum antarcticum]
MFKAIFATLLTATITALVVFVAMHPEKATQYAQRGQEMLTDTKRKVTASSKSTIDGMVTPEPADDDSSPQDNDDNGDAPAPTPQDQIEVLPKETLEGSVEPDTVSQQPESDPIEDVVVGTGVAPQLPKKTIPERLIDEAGKISDPRLRDQAYLSIVDYGLAIGDIDGALPLADEIESEDYRVTAQSKIAIGYARVGRNDEAFDMIGTIEDAEFADVVRMQVIETISGRPEPN